MRKGHNREERNHPIEHLVELIDEKLDEYRNRSMLPVSELQDILLDLRLECMKEAIPV